MHRVLKPIGTTLILDMNHDATKSDIAAQIQRMNMRGFDRWFVWLSFRTVLKNGAYTKAQFEELIAQTPFAQHDIQKRGIGFAVWLNKEDK
jgi:ubiquinone/menaquinone biosynthesis C-methylase UbiE